MSSEQRWSLPAVVGALGIVYGDIGTSPLYAFEESLEATGAHDSAAILGVLSLVFWSLALSVTLKYVIVMMRADNEGEGGVLALLALAQRRLSTARRGSRALIGLGLVGTALFFCDALITPAISVLSAVEGLELINTDLTRFVIPITLGVLALLFLIQRRGTAGIGKLFGPVMILWFAVLAVSGAQAIAVYPQVLEAINPQYGFSLLTRNPGLGLAILGAVFLTLTGGEALYADMGHFGKTPVRIAWFALVWPALLLNYFGQGALLLSAGHMIEHPLFSLVPASMLVPMLVLATAATVIASQAVITGAFSVARQAVQLDLLPRMRIQQTSAHEHGQIYVPTVNLLLFIAVVCFVLGFGSSSALSGAYGAAVVGTMFVTTLLGGYVASTQWNWPKWAVTALFGSMLAMDCVFIAGNLTKIAAGGWVPLSLGAVLFVLFWTWRSGRMELRAALAKMAVPRTQLGELLESVHRVEGTGVFLTSAVDFVPSALIRNLEYNKVAHERILILSIEIARRPRWDPAHRVNVEEILPGVFSVTAHFGFMETPDVSLALKACRPRGCVVFTEDSAFFLGRHIVRPRPRPGLKGLQRRLFARMQGRSAQASEFFRMPYRGVIVLNTAVEI